MMVFEKHELNREFCWQYPFASDANRTFNVISQEQAIAFDELGFFTLDNAFSARELIDVIAAIDPFEAEVEAFLSTQNNRTQGISRAGEITFRPHLVTVAPVLKQFSRHPTLRGLVHDLMGTKVRLYWDQSVYKKPKSPREFPWHQDNGYTFVLPQQYLTCWIALTDATQDNGCPWVVPGVHRQGTLKHKLTPLGYECFAHPDDAQPIELKAGSIAVFSSLTPHRTGPNITTHVRKSYILQYAPDGACMYRKGHKPLPCNDPNRQYLVT